MGGYPLEKLFVTYTGNFGVKVGKEGNFKFPVPEASSRVSSVFVPSSYPPPIPGLIYGSVVSLMLSPLCVGLNCFSNLVDVFSMCMLVSYSFCFWKAGRKELLTPMRIQVKRNLKV